MGRLKYIWFVLTKVPIEFSYTTKAEWPEKHLFGVYHTYYDGHWASAHLWRWCWTMEW